MPSTVIKGRIFIRLDNGNKYCAPRGITLNELKANVAVAYGRTEASVDKVHLYCATSNRPLDTSVGRAHIPPLINATMGNSSHDDDLAMRMKMSISNETIETIGCGKRRGV